MTFSKNAIPTPLILAFICILVISFSSCDLDNDDSFYPEAQRTFLLLSDANGKQLAIVEDNEIAYHQEQNFNISQSTLTDIAGEEELLWLGLNSSEILEINVKKKSVNTKKSLNGLIPNHIIIGIKYLLLIDTLNNKLGLWEKKKQEIVHTIELSKKPGSGTYLSGKFYIHLGEKHIGVLREVALLITNEIELPTPAGPIQSSSTNTLYLYSLQKPLTPYWIDYNIDNEVRVIPAVVFDQIFHSPYIRQQYGKEWLQNIELINGYMISSKERDTIFSTVNWAAIDFFEGAAWLTSQGNLVNVKLDTRAVQSSWPFADSVEMVWTYIAE